MEYAGSLLNFAWLAVCLAAFTWFLASAGRRSACSQRLLMCRALALGLALVSLFPCVSATDDSVRLTVLNSKYSSTSTQRTWDAHHTSTEILATLVGMLEELEAAQVATVIALIVSLCLFALALSLQVASLDRFLPSCAGRAPPCFSPVSL
jgi:hypothetical protein